MALQGSAAMLLVEAPARADDEVVDAATITVPGDKASPWSVSSLTVGKAAVGVLNIGVGGVVISGSTVIGANAGSQGTMTVSGTGAHVEGGPPTAQFFVGQQGNGTLNVLDGGVVDNLSAIGVAQEAGSTGAVVIDGAGSLLRSVGALSYNQIGVSGNATVTVSHGGALMADTDIELGGMGLGKMTVSSGGVVSSRDGIMGNDQSVPDYSGATISGAGSRWNASGAFIIGRDGQGLLQVEQQGSATSVGTSRVGQGGAGNVVVEDAGSSWTNQGDVYIGSADAQGNPGVGTVYAVAGDIAANRIIVGDSASGQSLSQLYIVEDGAVSAPSGLVIGNVAGGPGEVNIGANLNQAPAGAGTLNTPTITFGAGSGYLVFNHTGHADGSGVVLDAAITGGGSLVQLSGDTTLTGMSPDHTGITYVAGGVLRVSGVLGNGHVSIGQLLPSGVLLVEQGGTLRSADITIGTGSLEIGTGGSVLTAGDVIVGSNSGDMGTLVLSDGGELSTVYLRIADAVGSHGELDIGAPPGTAPGFAGTLDPPPISFGEGTATINFNHKGNPDSSDYLFQSPIGGTGNVNVLAGVTVMTAQSTYAGPTTIYGPSNVAPNGATLAALGENVLSANSDYILAGGNLDLRQGNQTVGSLSNGGSIVFSDNVGAGQLLTVNGAYTSHGGEISMRTVLGDDNSVTDRLSVGSVAIGDGGATRMSVVNTGGLGALTTGDGIKLVQVNGGPSASAANAFVLNGRVAAGAYEYSLRQNGLATTDGNWYLRSTLMVRVSSGTAPPEVAVSNLDNNAPGAAITGSPAPDIHGSSPPATVEVPNYRPEVAVDMVTPVLARHLGLDMLGTLDEREGSTSHGSSAWGRVFGSDGSMDRRGPSELTRVDDFERHGPTYDTRTSGFQAGTDVFERDNDDGLSDVAGIYIGAARASSDVDAVSGGQAGSTSIDASALGGYWTRRSTRGWYLDSTSQATIYGKGRSKSVYGEELRTGGWGIAASVEAGYSIDLNEHWALEPQGQLVYQYVRLHGASDHYGTIGYGDAGDLQARFGAKLSHTLMTSDAHVLVAWATANLWHGSGQHSETEFTSLDSSNAVRLNADLGATRARFRLGLSYAVAAHASLFASDEYEMNIRGARGSSLGGRVGGSISW